MSQTQDFTKQILITNPVSNNNVLYGSYPNLAAACLAVKPELRKDSLTVSILNGPGGTAVEYWWPKADELLDEHLVLKTPFIADSNKVDKVEGWSLTQNNLSNALKAAYDACVSWISINGTNLINHLSATNNPHNTTAAQVGAYTKQETINLLSDAFDINLETLITTGGNKNNEPTPTKILRFSNMVTPTILSGLSNPVDGKRVIIINKTLQNLNILHESSASLEVNRLSNTNGQDLFIVVGGVCEYVYVGSLSRWLLVNIWATDYFASLVGSSKRAVSVTALGMAVADEIIELEYIDTARTAAYTKSTINTAYPLASKHQQVVCPNITGGGMTYKKYDDSTNDWIGYSTPKLT